MLFHSLTELRKREANVTVCQPSGVRCSSAHPRRFLEESDLIRVSKLGLNCFLCIASAIFQTG